MLAGAAVMMLGLAAAGADVAGSDAAVTVLTPEALAAGLRRVEGPQPGLEVARIVTQPGYSVLELRRTTSGSAEVHADWADVWYVIRGEATLVTGGVVVDGVTTEPGEIRGKGIAAGEQRQLKGGEVLVVPAGVPHWISKVEGEIVYLVVKAPAVRPSTK